MNIAMTLFTAMITITPMSRAITRNTLIIILIHFPSHLIMDTLTMTVLTLTPMTIIRISSFIHTRTNTLMHHSPILMVA